MHEVIALVLVTGIVLVTDLVPGTGLLLGTGLELGTVLGTDLELGRLTRLELLAQALLPWSSGEDLAGASLLSNYICIFTNSSEQK